MRPIHSLLVLAALCFVASAQAAVPRPGPYFVESGRSFTKPTGTIDLSGTNSFEVGATHWTSWSPIGATARTVFYVNTCKPDCAAGRYKRQPADLRFFRVELCRGKTVFTNFAVTSLAGKRLLAGDFRSIGYLRTC